MCVGPLKRINHWGPLSALGIIKIVSFATIYCSQQWWPPVESWGGWANSTLFLALAGTTIYNFLNAIYMGPGYVPAGWKPPEEAQYEQLQLCQVCQGYKAPRSHHCKKCGRCVLKMDHHCPWINGCVGYQNHTSFTLFLFFAVLGCAQASVILGCSLYRALYRTWYMYHDPQRVIAFTFPMFLFCVFAFGLAIGVVLAVGMLLYFQLKAIIRNITAIEEWIVAKAKFRRKVAERQGEEIEPFIYPYHLGTWRNIRLVLNRSCTPMGDGIFWDVAPGCDQFTLTREQLAQKVLKRQKSRPFTAIHKYSGYRITFAHGIRVLFSLPCTDEPRLALDVGDTIIVTRYNKHWIFGEKVLVAEDGEKLGLGRGWFPRCCAVPVVLDDPDDDDEHAVEIVKKEK